MSAGADAIPRLTPGNARDLLREHWGLAGEIIPLPSYNSQSFRLRTPAGAGWVLKIANAATPREVLKAQLAALDHLTARLPAATVPEPHPTLTGDHLVNLETGPGQRSWAYLLSYLEGSPLEELKSRPRPLLESLGRLVARVDGGLADFSHPATRRELDWDLAQAPRLMADAGRLAPPRRRVLAQRYLKELGEQLLACLAQLPAAVIHNDGNPCNVVVNEGTARRARGLIDFGDLVHTCRVFGPAIAAAYVMLGEDDPLVAAGAVVAGYHRVAPLEQAEIDLLFAAIRARLAASVTISDREGRDQPDNEYLKVHAGLAWETMERLAGVDPAIARARFAAACGLARPGLARPGLARPGLARPGRSADEILAIRRRHLGPSLSVSYRRPLKIVRGWMQYLFDETGRAYLDGVNNVCHVGHCHPRVVAAAERQMELLNTNTRYLHDRLAEYAERLAASLPDPLSVCFFVCSGSEANDLALRLARAHTGRRGAVVVDGAYHGHTGCLIDVSPYKYDGPGGAGQPAHVRKVPMPDGYRGRYRRSDPEAGRKYAGHVAAAAAELHDAGHGVAAFFCEPILGCGGQVIPPAGFLEHAFAHVRRAGGVCIADEVQVGFGRVGSRFWAFETQGVVPDIVTLGKPIGNGHPLAAVVTTPEIATSFANGMEYFNTFGGNPVSCAIGLAVLEAIEEEGLQAHALAIGQRLLADLRKLRHTHALIGDVRGMGLFLGVELVRDRDSLEPAAEEASEVVERMKDRGVLLSTDGPFHNVIKIKPPLPFAAENAERLAAELDAALCGLGPDP